MGQNPKVSVLAVLVETTPDTYIPDIYPVVRALAVTVGNPVPSVRARRFFRQGPTLRRF